MEEWRQERVREIFQRFTSLRNNHLLTRGVNFYYYRSVVLGDAYIRADFKKVGKYTSVMEAEVTQNGKLCAKGMFDMAYMPQAEQIEME